MKYRKEQIEGAVWAMMSGRSVADLARAGVASKPKDLANNNFPIQDA